jgi:hypothetical protein
MLKRSVCVAQTDWGLFEHSTRKSVRGKQQEHVVPLHESHGHHERQLEYDNRFRLGLDLEYSEYKFSGGWKGFCFVARCWVDWWRICDGTLVVLLTLMGLMDEWTYLEL